jgi:Flp pilus assembly protein TadB
MSFTVTGIDGVLVALACLAFLVATIVAWLVAPRNYWAIGIALGLFLWALTGLVH